MHVATRLLSSLVFAAVAMTSWTLIVATALGSSALPAPHPNRADLLTAVTTTGWTQQALLAAVSLALLSRRRPVGWAALTLSALWSLTATIPALAAAAGGGGGWYAAGWALTALLTPTVVTITCQLLTHRHAQTRETTPNDPPPEPETT